MQQSIKIFKLGDVFIIKKERGGDFFFTTEEAFMIKAFNFSAILKYLLFRNLLSPKVLEGVLDEYYNRNN